VEYRIDSKRKNFPEDQRVDPRQKNPGEGKSATMATLSLDGPHSPSWLVSQLAGKKPPRLWSKKKLSERVLQCGNKSEFPVFEMDGLLVLLSGIVTGTFNISRSAGYRRFLFV